MSQDLSHLIHPSHASKWAQSYWRSGTEGAQAFSKQRACEQIALRSIFSSALVTAEVRTSPELRKQVIALDSRYAKRQRRYEPDWAHLVDGALMRESSGKAEPGRTPFHCPAYWQRYKTSDALFSFFQAKIDEHAASFTTLTNLLATLPADFPHRKELETEKAFHQHAVQKWTARQTDAQTRTASYLLPPDRDPHTLMGFRIASSLGFHGKDGVAVVSEPDPIGPHRALRRSLIGSRSRHAMRSTPDMDHGTHVSGIIAQAAPRGRIDYRTDLKKGSPLQDPIVNWSGGFKSSLAQTFYLASRLDPDMSTLTAFLEDARDQFQQEGQIDAECDINYILDTCETPEEILSALEHTAHEQIAYFVRRELGNLDDILLIQAIGNDSVTIDQNPLGKATSSWMSQNPDIQSLSIFAINLQQNGLYPHRSTTLPGETFAEMSLCAIGTDIISTLPDDEYGPMTGSSMAAPFITAAAVTLKGAFPSLTQDEIRHCLLEGATPIILDEQGIPHLIQNPTILATIPAERIQASKRFYGKGLLDVVGAITIAHRISQEKALRVAASSPL